MHVETGIILQYLVAKVVHKGIAKNVMLLLARLFIIISYNKMRYSNNCHEGCYGTVIFALKENIVKYRIL